MTSASFLRLGIPSTGDDLELWETDRMRTLEASPAFAVTGKKIKSARDRDNWDWRVRTAE
jgi:hypothetical protein